MTTLAAMHAVIMSHYGIVAPGWWRALRDDYGAIQLLIAGEETYRDLAKTNRVVAGLAPRVIGDLTPYGNDAVNASGAGVYGIRSCSGQPGITLDGATDYFECAGMAHASHDYTFVAVVHPDGTAGPQRLLGANNDEHVSAVVASKVSVHDGTAERAGMQATGRAQYLMLTLDSGTGEWRWYRDGQLLATGAYDGTWSWGAVAYLFASFGGEAGFLAGIVGLWMVVPSVLSAGDRADVDSLVMARYGLTFSPLSMAISYWHTMRAPYLVMSGSEVTGFIDRGPFGRNGAVEGAGATIIVTPDGLGVRHPGSGTKRIVVPTWARAQPHWDMWDGIMSRSGVAASNRYVVGGTALNSGALFLPSGETAPAEYSGAYLRLVGGSVTARKRTFGVYNGASSSIRQNGGAPTTGNVGANAPGGRIYFTSAGGIPADADGYTSFGGDYVPTAEEIAAAEWWCSNYGDTA